MWFQILISILVLVGTISIYLEYYIISQFCTLTKYVPLATTKGDLAQMFPQLVVIPMVRDQAWGYGYTLELETHHWYALAHSQTNMRALNLEMF